MISWPVKQGTMTIHAHFLINCMKSNKLV